MITWRSTDAGIASVDTAGVIHAVAAGRATVSAGVDGHTVSSVVEVRAADEQKHTRYTRIALGNASACALTVDHEVVCWGSNWTGALGNGKVEPFSGSLVPRPIAMRGDFVDVAVGGDHACAVDRGGLVCCWGSNDKAERGPNHGGPTGTPTRVPGVDGAVSVSAGQVAHLRRGAVPRQPSPSAAHSQAHPNCPALSNAPGLQPTARGEHAFPVVRQLGASRRCDTEDSRRTRHASSPCSPSRISISHENG